MDVNLFEQTRQLIAEVAGFIRVESEKAARVSLKGLNNLVTETDKESERRLVAGLSRILPASAFITEEDTTEDTEGEYQWIIDPIDGTTNFVHGIPCFAISVGLRHAGQTVMGIVHEITRNEQFSAMKGHGAALNGHSIKVSPAATLMDSVLATGFPYDDFAKEDEYWKALRDFTHKTRGIRRFGAAAVDLCYVACGRFDGFFEYSLSPWDVAAGGLIVQEAGGLTTDFNGGNDWLFGGECLATNGLIHPYCLETIRRHF